jgi:ATP-binding cassette, subfamily B, multidrug efflux pump
LQQKVLRPVFRFFEGLVDPYGPYTPSDTPPRRLWPFLKEYVRPFRAVFAVTGLLSVLVASADVALIWYVGRLVDVLASGQPAQVWADHGTEVLLVGAAILIVRPLVAGADVALLHNTILPNFGTMIRWRAHAHVLRQPVGWFETISRAASPTASCRRPRRRATRCSRPLTRWPLRRHDHRRGA